MNVRPEFVWTLGVVLVVSLLGSAILGFVTDSSSVALFGWFVFFISTQYPLLDSASRGKLDPCTAWLRRRVTGS